MHFATRPDHDVNDNAALINMKSLKYKNDDIIQHSSNIFLYKKIFFSDSTLNLGATYQLIRAVHCLPCGFVEF